MPMRASSALVFPELWFPSTTNRGKSAASPPHSTSVSLRAQPSHYTIPMPSCSVRGRDGTGVGERENHEPMSWPTISWIRDRMGMTWSSSTSSAAPSPSPSCSGLHHTEGVGWAAATTREVCIKRTVHLSDRKCGTPARMADMPDAPLLHPTRRVAREPNCWARAGRRNSGEAVRVIPRPWRTMEENMRAESDEHAQLHRAQYLAARRAEASHGRGSIMPPINVQRFNCSAGGLGRCHIVGVAHRHELDPNPGAGGSGAVIKSRAAGTGVRCLLRLCCTDIGGFRTDEGCAGAVECECSRGEQPRWRR